MIGLRVPSSSRTSEMSASFEIGVACEPARAPTGTLARCGRSIACGSGNAAFAAGRCSPFGRQMESAKRTFVRLMQRPVQHLRLIGVIFFDTARPDRCRTDGVELHPVLKVE